MHWIALLWPPEALSEGTPGASDAVFGGERASDPSVREALGWWALGFTPRVTWADEALLLEVSTSLRLWGGRQSLLQRMVESNPVSGCFHQAQAALGVVALARLRLRAMGLAVPNGGAAELPLFTLTAARPHLDLLARLGCRTWGDVAALPRGPAVRRFGSELRAALDVAWGLAPEGYSWLTLPEVFDQSLELPARVEDAQALMWAANRLLAALQVWLRARQLGVLAFELNWALDLKRVDGRPLPPDQSLVIRTAEPEQSMTHLRRLLAERLTHVRLLAPAVQLRMRSLETAPWKAGSVSFLPEDQRHGEPLHAFVERVSARLGSDHVLLPAMRPDHRPECAQQWVPAVGQLGGGAGVGKKRIDEGHACRPGALAPAWLLRDPLPLEVRDGRPCHRGLLRLLVGPQRIEAGWWGAAIPEQGKPAARDYYIAQNPAAELLWVYQERQTSHQESLEPRWFLQGIYA